MYRAVEFQSQDVNILHSDLFTVAIPIPLEELEPRANCTVVRQATSDLLDPGYEGQYFNRISQADIHLKQLFL